MHTSKRRYYFSRPKKKHQRIVDQQRRMRGQVKANERNRIKEKGMDARMGVMGPWATKGSGIGARSKVQGESSDQQAGGNGAVGSMGHGGMRKAAKGKRVYGKGQRARDKEQGAWSMERGGMRQRTKGKGQGGWRMENGGMG